VTRSQGQRITASPGDIRVYEYLYRFNQNLADASALLDRLEELMRLDTRQLRMLKAQIQEVRALVSQDVIEAQNEIELKQAARFYRKRLNGKNATSKGWARGPSPSL
jgi:hypothetical protein